MNSLLEMEEEKAIWSAKEKASIETIDEKVKLYHTETMSLSKRMLEVRSKLLFLKDLLLLYAYVGMIQIC